MSDRKITPLNIAQHELIGLEVEVIESSHPNLIGVKGKVIDETKNLLILELKNGRRVKVPKSICVFRFFISEKHRIVVKGEEIAKSPDERLKKCVKRW
ncbi:ribonuclease P protein subunit [archaeon]|nr:MAG: ribonuclease P protein subunit [archaeon]RLG66147.1 MAG: ribonuclease P protein subunit [archaeon]HDM23623.1 ribonuclease P protein component 1 [Candidatus Bathyarchaeota archaeon]